MWLGPCPLGFHSVALGVPLPLLLVRLVAVLLQVDRLLQVGLLLQLVVLLQADLPLVLLCQQVGLLLLPVGRELAAAVVVAAAPCLQ
jgi:hypothetical protein